MGKGVSKLIKITATISKGNAKELPSNVFLKTLLQNTIANLMD